MRQLILRPENDWFMYLTCVKLASSGACSRVIETCTVHEEDAIPNDDGLVIHAISAVDIAATENGHTSTEMARAIFYATMATLSIGY